MHRLENLLDNSVSYLNASIRSTIRKRASSKPTLVIGVLLALSLLCGVLFYMAFRFDAHYRVLPNVHWIWQNPAQPVILPVLPTAVYQSFPSLVGGLSVVLFLALVRPVNLRVRRIALTAAVITLALFEVFLGYFHWQDITATVLGMIAGLCITRLLGDQHTVQTVRLLNTCNQPPYPVGKKFRIALQNFFPVTGVVVFSSLLAVGSTYDGLFNGECARYNEENYCEEYKQSAVPVYMSYTKLRNSVAVESPRSPDRIGRLYLYGDYVFLNEVNEGIHIIDNTEPTAPVNLAFIRIPGNTEIAVRDNYLYADSYIDLLTLDINNPPNLTVIGREQSVFPYDSYQNIPQNITFGANGVNRDEGVIVSYRLAGS